MAKENNFVWKVCKYIFVKEKEQFCPKLTSGSKIL